MKFVCNHLTQLNKASELLTFNDLAMFLKRDDVNATKKDIAQHSSSVDLAFRMYRSATALAERFRLLSIIGDRAVHRS